MERVWYNIHCYKGVISTFESLKGVLQRLIVGLKVYSIIDILVQLPHPVIFEMMRLEDSLLMLSLGLFFALAL